MRNHIVIVFALFVNLINAQNGKQIKYTVNESWHFTKDKSDVDITEFVSYEKETDIVDIPHTWNDKDVIDESQGFYRGVGWYVKEIRIPTSYKDKQVFLFFEGVAMVAEIYINKQLATRHVGGFTRFVVPVSKYVDFDEGKEFTTFNVVVKADNSKNADVPPLNADFTFFGGMYRDVNLVVTEKIHFNIEDYAASGVFITTPNVSAEKGDVNLKVKIKNDAATTQKIKLITKIYSPNNKLVSSESKSLKLIAGISNDFDIKLKPVINPQLWSPNSPNLYKVVCEVYNGQTKIDESVNPLGFRWYSFDVDKGFFLNGKHLKLIGTNRHQDFKDVGNAVLDHIHVEDILRMKAMGSNFLRIAHYPQDAAILELCDRLGIITTVETPIIDTVTESEEFNKNCLSAQLEMIRQNYNHPSIVIWAYMNEILLHPKYKNDTERYNKYTKWIVNLAKEIEDLTRTEDPYRYTMIPNHGSLSSYKDAGLIEVPMIVGWNIYAGWYGKGYDYLQPKLEEMHHAVRKPIIVTEYGVGVDPRLHTLTPIRFDFSQEYAIKYHNHYINFFKQTPWVAGANVWNFADFNSEGRIDAVQSINNKGLVTIDRKPKDVFFYYQASLLKEPFIAIGTRTWNQRSNIEDKVGSEISTMPVQIFTNQKQIELFHNGISLGVQKPDSVIAVYNVPFVNGVNKLRAVAKGAKYCEDFSNLRINVLPLLLKDFPVGGLSINVGDQRFFYDDEIDQAWMFDKEYTEGSWGHVGGKPYVRSNKRKQQPYGAKNVIKGTFNDPIYQTQLVGIEKYRFDVPAGVYEVKLHFAEIEGTKAKHMPYDLTDENEGVDKITNRTFTVIVNDQPILKKIDILGQYGEYRAVKFKTRVSLKEGEPLIVDFKKIIGEPILNAIELYKKL